MGRALMGPCDPGAGVVFYAVRHLLLVLHAGGSIVLIGAATHHALQMRHYLRGEYGREKLEKLYAKVVAVAYALTFVVGALLYPSYRVHVRGLWLDAHAPAFSNLFDVKETYASLTLVVAIALGALAFTLRPAETPALTRVYAVMSLVVCAVVWFNVVAGILVVSAHGVG
jgi:hypothetical protein